MKILPLYYLGATVLFQVFCAVQHQATPSRPPAAAQAQDESLLQPTDVAYADAMEFARFLKDHGLAVRSVHRSHLESFFQGIEKAAFFRTNKGVVEVAFFPGLLDAEKVSVTYSKNESEAVPHRYKVEGQPSSGGGVIEAAYPVYFTMHKSWYIVTSESELDAVLKRALGQDGRVRRQ
jgi:hypothetical protein